MKMENCEIQLSVSRALTRQNVEIVLWPREALNELQQPLPGRLLYHIANVANHGGLCGKTNPVSSSFIVSESQPTTSALRYRLSVQGLDPGAWRVILGTLLAGSVRGFPVQRLEVASLNEIPRGELLAAEEAFAIPYPEAPEQLPFLVERSEFGSSQKDRLIRIAFQRQPDDDVVQELIAGVLSWDELSLGGYPVEGESPLENATDAVEAYLVDPLTVEHPLPIFVGSDLAFDAVVCIAWWFHERGHQVARVNIW